MSKLGWVRSPGSGLLATLVSLVFFSASAHAQLVDQTQVTPNPAVPGGVIAKSLSGQVGSGQGDEFTEGSSTYLIKRDPARSIKRGRQLFQRKFTRDQGQGPRVNGSSTGDIATNRALGAGLVDSCAGCHGRPKGSAGHGGLVTTRPDSRDSPHLFGLGLQEQLAEEITEDLRDQRADAIDAAMNPPALPPFLEFLCSIFPTLNFCPGPVTVNLVSKGISYGSLTAFDDGSVDDSGVEGVDLSLRVKPFFAEGGTISMREFIVGAMKAEMGLETFDPLLCDATGAGASAQESAAGFVFDPADELAEGGCNGDIETCFERPPVCDAVTDGDSDGVVDEIDAALLDHLEFYLLNYFKPGIGRQTSRSDAGLDLMEDIGCTSCHIQNLTIDSDRRIADVETVHDPVNGIFNRLFATASTRFVAVADGHVDANDGNQYPQLLPDGTSFVVENFFADLKRHNLGPNFHEREFDPNTPRVTEFLTEPLWGVATTAPYGHDGRSMNLEEVILRHGGEAQGSRDQYEALNDNDRSMISEFLATLILFPPDDTASNLNPGNPGTNDPQTFSEHGNINLGALFQIPYEGGE